MKESGGQKDVFPHKTAELFLTSLQRATSKLYDKRDLPAAQPARLEGSESNALGEFRILRGGRVGACWETEAGGLSQVGNQPGMTQKT